MLAASAEGLLRPHPPGSRPPATRLPSEPQRRRDDRLDLPGAHGRQPAALALVHTAARGRLRPRAHRAHRGRTLFEALAQGPRSSPAFLSACRLSSAHSSAGPSVSSTASSPSGTHSNKASARSRDCRLRDGGRPGTRGPCVVRREPDIRRRRRVGRNRPVAARRRGALYHACSRPWTDSHARHRRADARVERAATAGMRR